ncbi:S8 family serine peptidase [Lacihabitans sp. LS3-19]|uniref:S8 family serine peptidase n=3 Tax=Lacihabitans sp. LS3-19 TaxID=2487335 RepID=UPI0020CB8A25|nr:S8 family serine peptidase [Lacihabitans sp. LS3-19]
MFLVFFKVNGQEKYWIFLKNRDLSSVNPVSDKTFSNRKMLGLSENQISDFGPKYTDLEKIKGLGIQISNTSRWFNAVSVYLNSSQKLLVSKLDFVDKIQRINAFQSLASNKKFGYDDGIYLNYALHQIHAEAFLERGLLGDSVDIGIIDGGFYQADINPFLKNIFTENRVKDYKDFFIPPRKEFFNERKSNGDLHGTMVMSAVGGFDGEKKQLGGLALQSNYYLARTESSQQESRIEEDNWIAAIEWLDSLGVRLANSSLGYALGFTNPAENYSPNDMNGHTSVIAKGAQMAVNEKGMILIVSAGNEGENKKWGGIVSTPGDVEEVISVGANDENSLKMGYSSKGSGNVSFIKPDVTVYSYNGTSLAAPIVTGFVACMLQINPKLKASDIKKIFQESSSLTASPNNYLGYGIPDARLVLNQLEGKLFELKTAQKVKAKGKYKISSIGEEKAVVFHKTNAKNVESQEIVVFLDGKSTIVKPEKIKFSTVVLKDKIIEIKWK